jgi:uncharacterized membrane protein
MASLLAILSFLASPDDLMHVLIVLLSVLVLGIALLAYVKRRNTRYFLLTVAFFFLMMSQVVTFFEIFYPSDGLFMIPYLGLHVSHLFDFLMLFTFGLALVKSWDYGTVKAPKLD